MIRDQPIETSIESFVDASVRGINTAIPASIVSYNEEDRTAEIKIHYSDHYASEGTESNREDWPPIPDCPVNWPRSGKFIFTWPLEKGDPVLVVFSQRSLQEWSASDGKTDIGNFLLSTHGPSDAIVLPGLSPSKNKSGETVEIKITKDGEYQLKAEKVRLGSLDASKPVANGTVTATQLNDLMVGLNAARVILGLPPVVLTGTVASSDVFFSE